MHLSFLTQAVFSRNVAFITNTQQSPAIFGYNIIFISHRAIPSISHLAISSCNAVFISHLAISSCNLSISSCNAVFISHLAISSCNLAISICNLATSNCNAVLISHGRHLQLGEGVRRETQTWGLHTSPQLHRLGHEASGRS